MWVGGSNIAVYQGGAAFRGSVKLPAKARDIFISNGGIGIIPLKRVSAQIKWYNPARFKSCQGLLGAIWDYITTIGVVSVVAIASLASEITLSSPRSIDDLIYPGSGCSYYVSKTLIGSSLGGERSDELRTTSDQYPFIYLALALFKQVASGVGLSNYPAVTVNGPIDVVLNNCNQIMPSEYCTRIAVGTVFQPFNLDFKFNDIDIGAPVFSRHFCATYCSEFGLVGLIKSFSTITINVPLGNNLQYPVEFVFLDVVKSPTDFTTAGIANYTKELNISEGFNMIIDAINKEKKTIAGISAVFPIAIAELAALAIDWSEVSYENGYRQVEERAMELKNVYNEVLSTINNCIEAYPGLTRNQKTMYEQMVRDYLNGVLPLVNPDWSPNELKGYLLQEATNYLSNYEISC